MVPRPAFLKRNSESGEPKQQERAMKHRDGHQQAAGRKSEEQEDQRGLEDEDIRELDPENDDLDDDELDDEDTADTV
jgi:hypothetical protein